MVNLLVIRWPVYLVTSMSLVSIQPDGNLLNQVWNGQDDIESEPGPPSRWEIKEVKVAYPDMI